MALRTGQRLGHYVVIGPIGAGGMGEVYRATDTRLQREVAIKVLPEEFARDPERLARFQQEARVLAALNHPNIATIHGLEEADGIRCLVMELVPGQTLAERLASGPIDVEGALATARQIAEALEAAHERGIIHRDLKPANVKLTPEGKVKVLDFGLAKVFAPAEASPGPGGAAGATPTPGGAAGRSPSPAGRLGESPTATYGGTKDGIILGTAAYMSPEQARGRPIDRRTDIWSFGCLLYEMLTGRQPFAGDTLSDTIAAILKQEAAWEAIPAETPAEIRRLLRRCLQKDPQRRLQHIGDARVLIEEAVAAGPEAAGAGSGDESAAGPGRLTPAARRRAILVRLGAGAAAIAILVVTFLIGRGGIGTKMPGGDAGPAIANLARLTHDEGIAESPSWSPDGTLVAFSSNRSGNAEIYVRRVEGGEEINITNDPAEDIQPAFSPDGRWVAFISTRSSKSGLSRRSSGINFRMQTTGGDLWIAPSLGGQARRIATDANQPVWRPDGGAVVYVGGIEAHSSIVAVAPDGTGARELLPAAASNHDISMVACSPGGKWITFGNNSGGLGIMPAGGGEPRLLLESAAIHAWAPDGRGIYFVSPNPQGGTRIESIGFDETGGAIAGRPRLVGLTTGLLVDLAVSADGRHLAVGERDASMNLMRLPLSPDAGSPAGPEVVLDGGDIIDNWPQFSPDGRRIAYGSNRLGGFDVWIEDLDGGRRRRVLLPGETFGVVQPHWVNDDLLVINRFVRGGLSELLLVAPDGSRAEVLEPAAARSDALAAPDGRSILHSKQVDGVYQLFRFDLATRETRQITTSPGDKFCGIDSPDGRWIAFNSNEGGTIQMWRMPAGGGKEERLTTGSERMRHFFWSPDGRWIYVQPSHRNVWRLPAGGGPLQQVTRFPESGLYIDEPAISPDGRTLTYARATGGSSLWLLTLENDADGGKR